jgi:hypothetical protein
VIGIHHLERVFMGHLFNIRACGEGFFTPRNHCRANLIVLVESVECVHQFTHELIVEGIERLRTVECNESYTPAPFNQDGCISHVASGDVQNMLEPPGADLRCLNYT